MVSEVEHNNADWLISIKEDADVAAKKLIRPELAVA